MLDDQADDRDRVKKEPVLAEKTATELFEHRSRSKFVGGITGLSSTIFSSGFILVLVTPRAIAEAITTPNIWLIIIGSVIVVVAILYGSFILYRRSTAQNRERFLHEVSLVQNHGRLALLKAVERAEKGGNINAGTIG